MLILLKNGAPHQFSTQQTERSIQQRFRSESRSASREGLTASKVQGYFQSTKDFRGISDSPEVGVALQAMVKESKGTTPIFWGFRHYAEGDPLTDAELNSLHAFKDIGVNSSSVKLEKPVILADIHVDHNGIPREVYLPYYQKIKATAESLQIPAVWLSDIYKKLQLQPEHIANAGARLIQKHTGAAPDIAKLPERDYVRFKTQAET